MELIYDKLTDLFKQIKNLAHFLTIMGGFALLGIPLDIYFNFSFFKYSIETLATIMFLGGVLIVIFCKKAIRLIGEQTKSTQTEKEQG